MQKTMMNSAKQRSVLVGVVAVIGCDGTGKSSLTADLLAKAREHGPAERRYLGLVSGEMGDKIKHLPFIGVRLERHLATKARRAQNMRKKLPGTGTALVMFLLSLWRKHQFRKIVALSRRGATVITDRFPQAEIPGFHYDGPGLPAARSSSWLVTNWPPGSRNCMNGWQAMYRPWSSGSTLTLKPP